ncbi:transcriptional regulator opi1 [Coemansia sp. RSA 2050]|nr:transcriptional regulator opi1 [Coemansia sp. RSA 2050]
MIKGISLFVLALLSVAASVYAAPQPVATATAASQAGVELYQGLHLPPGLRSRQRAKMHRRDIPYGGYLTFGNYQAPTSVPMAGTSVLESGVRKMCQPITKRIDVAQLDSFACRQLDNLGYVEGHPSNVRKRTMDQAEDAPTDAPDKADTGRWRVGNLVASARDRAVAYREDSIRRLRYCLEWLTYATALLRQHIEDLRRLLSSLQEAARHAFAPSKRITAGPEEAPAERLQQAKREIVGAVRKAVGVVSNYAGSVLPAEARRQVRDLILNLPGRWATAHTGGSATGSGSPSVASDGPGSPPLTGRASDAHLDVSVRHTLTFAMESFHMLDSVRAVFQGLYNNAERWIGTAAPVPAVPPLPPPPDSKQAYRDPPPQISGESSAWHRPHATRRRLPLNNTGEPLLGANSRSLADIGERMRLMGVDHDCEDTVSFKRNRTREPTPTRL